MATGQSFPACMSGGAWLVALQLLSDLEASHQKPVTWSLLLEIWTLLWCFHHNFLYFDIYCVDQFSTPTWPCILMCNWLRDLAISLNPHEREGLLCSGVSMRQIGTYWNHACQRERERKKKRRCRGSRLKACRDCISLWVDTCTKYIHEIQLTFTALLFEDVIVLNSAISACEKGASWSQAFVAGKTTGDLTFRDFLMDTRDPYILATLHVSPPVVRTVSTLTTGHGVAEEFPSTPAVGRCILALDLGENLRGLTSDVIPFQLWPLRIFGVYWCLLCLQPWRQTRKM